MAEIFTEVEPLGGRRHVEVTERRTAKDWAAFVKGMLDERYPQAVNRDSKIDWRFTTADARIKLKRLYPNF